MQVDFIDGKAIMSQEDFLRRFGQTVPATTQGVSLEQEATDILSSLGVPRNILGFSYLREAIILTTNDSDYVNRITKKLYPAIARKFSTTPSRAERAIRHAIEVSCRKNPDGLKDFFRRDVVTLSDKPVNSEFIATIADQLRLRLRRQHETV